MNAEHEAAYKKLRAHEWLIEWGCWLRDGSKGYGLGSAIHPLARLMGRGTLPGRSIEYAEHRVAAVQEVVTHMLACSHDPRYTEFRRNTFAIYTFCIKLEYEEANEWRREEMVGHIRARFKRPKYNERSLLNHLNSAVSYVGVRLGIDR